MTSTDLTLAWASPERLTEIWQLESSMGTTWAHPEAFFEESLQYKRLLLASVNDKPVAYLIYEVIWGNTAFLSLLKVSQEFQRKGFGKAMISALENHLRSLGFKSYVTSSETTNANTKQFFPSLGFVRIGELQMQHGEEMFYLKQLT